MVAAGPSPNHSSRIRVLSRSMEKQARSDNVKIKALSQVTAAWNAAKLPRKACSFKSRHAKTSRPPGTANACGYVSHISFGYRRTRVCVLSLKTP